VMVSALVMTVCVTVITLAAPALNKQE
jgi:hypothetical protein